MVQSIITAVYSVIQVANQILELTPIDEIVLSEGFAGNVAAIGLIVHEAKGLAYDIGQLDGQVQRLFSLESAPADTYALQERLAEIRRVQFEVYWYAMQVQTLLRTLLSTVGHITNLVNLVSNYIGNMSGNQNMTQVEGKVAQLLAELETQTAAYNRAQSVDEISEPMIIESLKNINEAQMADHPR